MRSFAFALVCCAPLLAFGQGFTPPCELPFADIAERRAIDGGCDLDGDGSPSSRLQNAAKNNFCATGDPALVTFFSFRQLQRAVEAEEVLGRNYGVPASRDMLRDLHETTEGATIGEGSVVRVSAFISDAHYSNVSNGERVNCNLTGRNNNDMHIELVQVRGETDQCKSITAEIPPHFRPDIWAERTLNDIDRPIRFTGQLFFDASHKPCRGNSRPAPRRFSTWEIHPVYNVEVCINRSLAGCKADDDSKWMSLDEYLNPAEDVLEEEHAEEEADQ